MKYLVLEIWDSFSDSSKLDDFITNATTEEFDRIFYIALNDYLYWQPRDKWSTLVNVLAARNKKLEVLVGLSSYTPMLREPSHANIDRTFWDSYWLIKTFVNLQYQEQATEYKYHYVSLNNRCHVWRCQLMDLLAKYDLLKHGAVSWHNTNDGTVNTKFKWKYFEPTVLKLTDNFNDDKYQYVVPQEYSTSFSQLVPESHNHVIEISEKTATPLILGKPFLVAGGCKNSQLQVQMGFEQYNEIFDYSFDNIESMISRYDRLVQNFTELSTIPLGELPSLYEKIKLKVLHNQNRVKEIAFDFASYPDTVKEIIDIYETTGDIVDKDVIEIYRKLLQLKPK